MLVCLYVAPTFNSYLICLAWLFLCVSTDLSYFYLYIYQHQYVVNFHQRYSTTSVSNTTKSFCVPWSWTNDHSCWNKSHRKNGGWLSTIRGFYSKTTSLNEMWKKSIPPFFWRLFVSQWQLWCNISWWPPSVGCSLRESTSTCLLWKFTTSTPRCTCITSSHGVFPWLILLRHVLEVVPCSHIWCCHQVKCFEFIFLYLWVGFPMIMMAISLGIAAAQEGIKSYVNDK